MVATTPLSGSGTVNLRGGKVFAYDRSIGDLKEGGKVLVVDDEPSVLRLVAGGLSKQGYEVHAAPHPVQAFGDCEGGESLF